MSNDAQRPSGSRFARMMENFRRSVSHPVVESRARQNPLSFEALEPRLLMSGDPLAVQFDFDALDANDRDVILRVIDQTQTNPGKGQIVRYNNPSVVLAEWNAGSAITVSIDGSATIDRLFVDESFTLSKGASVVAFTGGGEDTLTYSGKADSVSVTLSGSDDGTISTDNSKASVKYLNIGSVKIDTETKELEIADARLGKATLVLDGVSADTLSVKTEGSSASLTFRAPTVTLAVFGEDSSLFSDTIRIDGLATDFDADLVVSAAPKYDPFEDNPAAPVTNGLSGAAVSETADLTIGGKVIVAKSIATHGGTVSLLGETVTINTGVAVDTRAAAGSKAGDIEIAGRDIKVLSGAALRADGDDADNSGDITLSANLQRLKLSSELIDFDHDAPVSISVSGATIKGGSVSITASDEDGLAGLEDIGGKYAGAADKVKDYTDQGPKGLTDLIDAVTTLYAGS